MPFVYLYFRKISIFRVKKLYLTSAAGGSVTTPLIERITGEFLAFEVTVMDLLKVLTICVLYLTLITPLFPG
jgi:hypothetical protein